MTTKARTWLITGAAGGLGRELVRVALAAGHDVLATDRDAGALPAPGSEPPDTATAPRTGTPTDTGTGTRTGTATAHRGGRLRTMALDVTDPDAARAAVRRAVDAFGSLDVVVNGAAYRGVGSVEDMPEEEFRHTLETNLFGAVNVVRAALPVLRAQRRGHLVQISTIGGRRAQAGLGAYQTSKWALGGFSEVLAREVAPLGVHVTLIEPGGIFTPWAAGPLPTGRVRPEYEPTVGVFARTYDRNPDVQRGDPARMARAVLRVTEEPQPPVRLLLGSDAVWLAPLIAEARAAEDARWRWLSLTTDRDGLPDFADTDVARMVRPPGPGAGSPGPQRGSGPAAAPRPPSPSPSPEPPQHPYEGETRDHP